MTETITVSFPGVWRKVLQGLLDEQPDELPSEVLKQALALMATVMATDSQGKRVEVLIRFQDANGSQQEIQLVSLAPYPASGVDTWRQLFNVAFVDCVGMTCLSGLLELGPLIPIHREIDAHLGPQ